MLFGKGIKMNMKRRKGVIVHNIPIFVLVIIIISFSLYIMNPWFVNSDNIEGVMWAQATLNFHRLISDSFWYPYAIPFGANLFMLPFVKLYGVSLLANSLGMLSFFAIIVITLFCFGHVIFENYIKAANFTSVILLTFRSTLGKNLLTHILYAFGVHRRPVLRSKTAVRRSPLLFYCVYQIIFFHNDR